MIDSRRRVVVGRPAYLQAAAATSHTRYGVSCSVPDSADHTVDLNNTSTATRTSTINSVTNDVWSHSFWNRTRDPGLAAKRSPWDRAHCTCFLDLRIVSSTRIRTCRHQLLCFVLDVKSAGRARSAAFSMTPANDFIIKRILFTVSSILH